MQFSVVQIALVMIWTGLCGIDLFDGLLHFHRPLVSGMVIGFILGDLQTGLVTGATLELILLGAVPVGGAQPPNVVIGGVAGIVLAIASGFEPAAAVGVAIPFAVFMQALITLYFTMFVPVMHSVDASIEKGNGVRAIVNANFLGMFTLFCMYALVAGLITIGGNAAAAQLQRLPQFVMHGLEVSGGMLTAVGLAILLKIMFAPRYAIYLALGFMLVTFFKAPILSVAGIAVVIALIEYYLTNEITAAVMKAGKSKPQGDSDGI